MKYIIVGGVAGGATAAARLRRIDESAEIVLLEKGEYISYANCGLPYYIGGVIGDREKLLLQTPESFGGRFNIDVRIKNEVIKVLPDEQKILVRDKNNIEYVEKYDKLLLSPGANPVIPPLEGIHYPGVFTLRNVHDTDKIKSFIDTNKPKRAVIVGAGFIGLEMAENLHHAGIQVSIVEMGNQVMGPLDYSMASFVHSHLYEKGISLYLSEGVTSFQKIGDTIKVQLKSGKQIETDVVLLSIGVRPNTQLAKDANIKLGETGGIWVDEYLQTSEKDIYAVGDVIEYPHHISGKPWLNYLANPANRQARIVADNMVKGNYIKYEGAIGTAIAKIFDLTVATTGLPGKRLKQLGMPYETSTTSGASHAGYYPGAMPLTIKLTFHPETGKIYGAQAVGYEGIDKRIDQIAMLIKHNGTICDLIATEHAYAPPFSSAKDPIAIAGYVAINILEQAMPSITWRDVKEHSDEYLLIDTRTAEEYAFGTIDNAINIPLDEIRKRISEIPKNRPIVLFCAVGLRGYVAQRILIGNGYKNTYNLKGGYKLYSSAIIDYTDDKYKNLKEQRFDNSESKCKQEKEMKRPITIDACGLQCPGPIMKVKKAMDNAEEGERIEITATDAAFARDAEAWCNTTGNLFISKKDEKGKYTVLLEKGRKQCEFIRPQQATPKGKTLILFSDDLDKALATFVLANGAAATGQKVTIFFTFWGLNVLKKENKPKVEKDIWGKMFGWMLPKHSKKLALSKMNMMGAGSKMMRHLMKIKGVDSLESLRQQALDNGVEFIACQMSMDMMGIKKEELMDEVSLGGVATYMDRANDANMNLFI